MWLQLNGNNNIQIPNCQLVNKLGSQQSGKARGQTAAEMMRNDDRPAHEARLARMMSKGKQIATHRNKAIDDDDDEGERSTKKARQDSRRRALLK